MQWPLNDPVWNRVAKIDLKIRFLQISDPHNKSEFALRSPDNAGAAVVDQVKPKVSC